MPRTGATIPADIDPTETYRRVLCVPGSVEWLALVNGALWVLTQSWYWDAASGDVQAVTERAQQMYFEFQDQNGACDVVAIVGEVKMLATPTIPDGWLYCNGDEVAKATYPLLWDAITTFWGTAANPTLNFKLPDFRNKFPIGYAVGGGTPAFGSYGGEATHTLTTAEIPAHSHDAPVSTAASGSTGQTAVASSGVFLQTRLATQNTGGGGAHNNMPPYGALSFIIYAGL